MLFHCFHARVDWAFSKSTRLVWSYTKLSQRSSKTWNCLFIARQSTNDEKGAETACFFLSMVGQTNSSLNGQSYRISTSSNQWFGTVYSALPLKISDCTVLTALHGFRREVALACQLIASHHMWLDFLYADRPAHSVHAFATVYSAER